MSNSAILRFAKQIRSNPGHDAVFALRRLAAKSGSRTVLNWLYTFLSLDQKAWCHGRFSKIFRDSERDFEDGFWRVYVCGKRLKVPLRRELLWLDWDAALSILGHEPELKETYTTLVGLSHPPQLVLDIGANYGTHSIVFLRHGIRTISFEPNANCHAWFRSLCDANGITCEVEPLALGAADATVHLWYPEHEEWLGTTDSGVRDRLHRRSGQLSKISVPQTTIDRYVQMHALMPHVLKIDTEGSDFLVLRGAEQTLLHCRPLVLFESWRSGDRQVLVSFFGAHRYEVCRLPLLRASRPVQLAPDQFCSDDEINFAAVPQEIAAGWPPRFA